jgi:hypothetical protein
MLWLGGDMIHIFFHVGPNHWNEWHYFYLEIFHTKKEEEDIENHGDLISKKEREKFTWHIHHDKEECSEV